MLGWGSTQTVHFRMAKLGILHPLTISQFSSYIPEESTSPLEVATANFRMSRQITEQGRVFSG